MSVINALVLFAPPVDESMNIPPLELIQRSLEVPYFPTKEEVCDSKSNYHNPEICQNYIRHRLAWNKTNEGRLRKRYTQPTSLEAAYLNAGVKRADYLNQSLLDTHDWIVKGHWAVAATCLGGMIVNGVQYQDDFNVSRVIFDVGNLACIAGNTYAAFKRKPIKPKLNWDSFDKNRDLYRARFVKHHPLNANVETQTFQWSDLALFGAAFSAVGIGIAFSQEGEDQHPGSPVTPKPTDRPQGPDDTTGVVFGRGD